MYEPVHVTPSNPDRAGGMITLDSSSLFNKLTSQACASPHFPSSINNSLVSGDCAWVIRACSILCAGMSNVEDSTPIRLAIPRGGIHNSRPLVSRAPKDNL